MEQAVVHREHLVEFYGTDERRLACDVGAFLAGSLSAGGGAIVIAAEGRRNQILDCIRQRTSAGSERILSLDDSTALASLMRDGRPDAEAFEVLIGERVRTMCRRYGRVRAYGEIVGRLWRDRAFDAAIRLENLWNDLLENCEVGLFCGYPIDVLSEDFQIGTVRSVLSAHTELLPSLPPKFGAAMENAMDDVLGANSHGLRAVAQRGFPNLASALPPAESTILRLRHSLPRYADEILGRATRLSQVAETASDYR